MANDDKLVRPDIHFVSLSFTRNMNVTDITPLAAQTAREVAEITHVKPIATAMRWLLILLPSCVFAMGVWAWFARKVLDLDPTSTSAGIVAIGAVLAIGGVALKKLLDKKKDD